MGDVRGYRVDDIAREELVRTFDLGITHFDFANNYGVPPGNAEVVCGRMIREVPRDELIISNKAGFRMWPGPYGELRPVLANEYGKAGLAAAPAFFTGVAAFATVATAWVTRGARWLNGWVAQAEEVKQRVDSRVAQRRAQGQAEIKMLEQVLQRRNTEFQDARRKTLEAQQAVTEKRVELQGATPGRLLANFITDRIKSDDYRQYLGVLAVVRRDFERLSNLMELQNWQLLKPVEQADGKPEVREGVRKFATLEDERKEEATRINRIVLYIDDLDRCPPRKVVQVLQAVHLLLAFPLFIVVVGVDARWVQRSLQTTYGELLTGGGATPEDYLEKVFQIPFWLEDTPPDGRADMLNGLLKDSVEIETPPSNGKHEGAQTDGKREEAQSDEKREAPAPDGKPNEPVPETAEHNGVVVTVPHVQPVAVAKVPDPEALKLRQRELD